MATAKTIALTATPAVSATVKKSTKTAIAKTVAVKSATKKQASRKSTLKTPLSKAFVPVKVAKTTTPVKTAKVLKAEKPKKPKLVRDSFTIPKIEYVVLETLKQRATKLTHSVKKSELLRAGIKALAALSDAAFLSALEKVPAIKTGRPASAK